MPHMSVKRGSFLEYIRKEGSRFARYARAHPHFRRNILLDALVSTSIVLVGFGIVNHASGVTRTGSMLQSGGVEMSSEELIQHVKSAGIVAYWLGPIKGYKYTIICTERKEIIVSYLPQGVSVNDADRFNLTVESYARNLVHERKTLSNIASDKVDFVSSNGTMGTISSAHPQIVTFSLPNSDTTVDVQYPTASGAGQANGDAKQLKLISESKPYREAVRQIN